ncbi:MAG: hypothetical protein ACPGN3_17975, partial [Opitutales bacterium]
WCTFTRKLLVHFNRKPTLEKQSIMNKTSILIALTATAITTSLFANGLQTKTSNETPQIKREAAVLNSKYSEAKFSFLPTSHRRPDRARRNTRRASSTRVAQQPAQYRRLDRARNTVEVHTPEVSDKAPSASVSKVIEPQTKNRRDRRSYSSSDKTSLIK